MSTDTWADNRDFARANALEFPLLSDWPSRATVEACGVLAEDGATSRRVTFVLDSAGVVRGVIADASPGAHAAEALQVLREVA